MVSIEEAIAIEDAQRAMLAAEGDVLLQRVLLALDERNAAPLRALIVDHLQRVQHMLDNQQRPLEIQVAR